MWVYFVVSVYFITMNIVVVGSARFCVHNTVHMCLCDVYVSCRFSDNNIRNFVCSMCTTERATRALLSFIIIIISTTRMKKETNINDHQRNYTARIE